MVGNSSAPNCLNCRRGRSEFKEHFYCWRIKISQVGECLAVVPIRENSKEEEERMGSMLKREKERREKRTSLSVRSFVQSRRSTDNEARGRGEGGRDRGRDGQITLPPLFLSLSPLPTRKQSLLPMQGGYRREGGGRFCYRASSSSSSPPLSLRPTRQSFRLFWRRLFEVFPLGVSAWKTRKRPPPPSTPKEKRYLHKVGISPCFFRFFPSILPPSVFFFLEFVLLRKWFFWPLKNVGEGRTGKEEEEEEEGALHRRLPSPSLRRSVPSPFVRRQRAG